MSDKPEQPDPKVVAALRSVVEEEHPRWALVRDGYDGVWTAELHGTSSAQVSSATPDGLVRAILSYEERERATAPIPKASEGQ